MHLSDGKFIRKRLGFVQKAGVLLGKSEAGKREHQACFENPNSMPPKIT